MTYLGHPEWKRRETVSDLLKMQIAGMKLASPSPFYLRILENWLADCEAGDRRIDALCAPTPMSYDAAVPIRLLAGIHRCVLEGIASEVAQHWPTDAVPGDADEVRIPIQCLFDDPPALLVEWLTRDPQTNEVGRSTGLAAGLCEVARITNLPIRLFEIGSSAGLNLRLDGYHLTNGHGDTWGDLRSLLQFDSDSFTGRPPFDSGATIVERRGCDLNPIDATTHAGALQLLSYVWPDQHARIARLRAALEVASNHPVVIDAASADAWIEQYVRPQVGTVTVLMHSIMWQYLSEEIQSNITNTLEQRALEASSDAPLAWLTLEPAPELIVANITLRIWPTGETRVLGTAGFHGPPISWNE